MALATQPGDTTARILLLSDGNQTTGSLEDAAALAKAAGDIGTTIFHPTSTCRMGPAGQNTVVDDKLKVHGLEGLRVADASIFPTMPSGNTNAPSIMVGEKMADILKAAA